MTSEKAQHVAYIKGFDAGRRKFKAEFETLLEVSEGRLREINLLKLEVKEGISIGAHLLKHNKNLKAKIQSMYEDAAGADKSQQRTLDLQQALSLLITLKAIGKTDDGAWRKAEELIGGKIS